MFELPIEVDDCVIVDPKYNYECAYVSAIHKDAEGVKYAINWVSMGTHYGWVPEEDVRLVTAEDTYEKKSYIGQAVFSPKHGFMKIIAEKLTLNTNMTFCDKGHICMALFTSNGDWICSSELRDFI